jgi:hypothetical protein
MSFNSRLDLMQIKGFIDTNLQSDMDILRKFLFEDLIDGMSCEIEFYATNSTLPITKNGDGTPIVISSAPTDSRSSWIGFPRRTTHKVGTKTYKIIEIEYINEDPYSVTKERTILYDNQSTPVPFKAFLKTINYDSNGLPTSYNVVSLALPII